MTHKILCALLAAALLPGVLNAQTSGAKRAVAEKVTEEAGERLSYTYVQAGYNFDTQVNTVGSGPGSLEGDGDGYAVQASYDLTPTIHMLGDYNSVSAEPDGGGNDQDLQRVRAGFGLHSESGANADNSYFLNLTYERYDFDQVSVGNGFGFEAGWRHGFTGEYLSRLELDLSVQYIDLDDDALLDNEIGARGQLLYDLTQRFALFLSYEDNQIL